MAQASINIAIKAVNDAKAALQAAAADVDKLGASTTQLNATHDKSSSIMASVKGNYLLMAGAVGAVSAAVGGAVAMSARFIAAAAEDEASQVRLRQAVENTGATYGMVKGEIEKLIKSGQALAFTDDQTRAGLSMLEAQTGSHTEAVKRLGFAQDLARGTGMDLVTASRLLGKVTDENVNVLNRYGISVKKGSTDTELFAAVQQKFGGQAKAYAETSAASFDRLKDRISEAQEELGYKLMPVVARGAEQAVKAIDGMTSALQTLVNSGPYKVVVEFFGGVFDKDTGGGGGIIGEFARFIGGGAAAPFKIAGMIPDLFGNVQEAIGRAARPDIATMLDQRRPRFDVMSEAETGGGGTFRTPEQRVKDETAVLLTLFDSYQKYYNVMRRASQSVEEATQRTVEFAGASGEQDKATLDIIGSTKSLEDNYQQLLRSTNVLTEATAVAAKAEDALGDVRRKMAGDRLDAEITAYLEGGEKKLAIVRDEQMLQAAAIESTAQQLTKVFGIQVPAALEYAAAHVTATMAKLRKDAEEMLTPLQRQAAGIGGVSRSALDEAGFAAMLFGPTGSIGVGGTSGFGLGGAIGELRKQGVNDAGPLIDAMLLINPGLRSDPSFATWGNVTINVQALDGRGAADAVLTAMVSLEERGALASGTTVN